MWVCACVCLAVGARVFDCVSAPASARVRARFICACQGITLAGALTQSNTRAKIFHTLLRQRTQPRPCARSYTRARKRACPTTHRRAPDSDFEHGDMVGVLRQGNGAVDKFQRQPAEAGVGAQDLRRMKPLAATQFKIAHRTLHSARDRNGVQRNARARVYEWITNPGHTSTLLSRNDLFRRPMISSRPANTALMTRFIAAIRCPCSHRRGVDPRYCGVVRVRRTRSATGWSGSVSARRQTLPSDPRDKGVCGGGRVRQDLGARAFFLLLRVRVVDAYPELELIRIVTDTDRHRKEKN